jgi:hypothetical protein
MAPLSVLLLVLLVVWAALLFGGYIFGRTEARGERRMSRRTRMASSFVLVAAAWLFIPIGQGSGLGPYPIFIAIGMTFGFLGDLFLAHLIPFKEHMLPGMASFALGHVAYIVGGLLLGGVLDLHAPALRVAAWLVWLLVGALGWYYLVFRGQKKPGVLHWAALPYALLLSSTVGVATGLALLDARLIPLALGAALFLFSDLMIAANVFAGLSFQRINIDDLIWLTYGPGQCLIVYTTAFLLLILR